MARSYSIKIILRALLVQRWELFFSSIFALVFTLGHLLSTYENIDVHPDLKRLAFIYLIGFVVAWSVIALGLVLVKQKCKQKPKTSTTIFFKSVSDKKLWLFTSLLIFTFYSPIILVCHSMLSPDSWSGIRQLTGDLPLSNAHPIIFTAFSGLFVRIGLLFGSLELGIILFSLTQSAIMAMIFARVIVWMRQERVSVNAAIASFIFYTILPVNAVAGIIMWKDILFAGFGLLFLISLRQLYIEGDKFFTTKKVLHFVLLAFLFCTWRNNGIYAYCLFLSLVTVISYKLFFNKRYLLLLLSPVFLFFLYSGLVSLVTNSTGVVTAIVPLQQISRTVKYHGNSISEEDKRIINRVLPFERLASEYNPYLSDPVAHLFNQEEFNKNKGVYARLWLRLFLGHKKTYIAAFLYNTYGYVYPHYPSPTTTDILLDNSSHINALEVYSDSAYTSGGKPAVATYRDLVSSILPVLRNIGFYSCALLLGLYIAIIKKRKELAGVFILLFCLFLTTVLGPVNGEFRYLYLFVVSAPFILVSACLTGSTKTVNGRRSG